MSDVRMTPEEQELYDIWQARLHDEDCADEAVRCATINLLTAREAVHLAQHNFNELARRNAEAVAEMETA